MVRQADTNTIPDLGLDPILASRDYKCQIIPFIRTDINSISDDHTLISGQLSRLAFRSRMHLAGI